MISLILGGVWKYVALLIGAIAGLGGIYAKGRADAAAKARLREAEARNEANERINDADVSRGDAAADADWLRDRAKR